MCFSLHFSLYFLSYRLSLLCCFVALASRSSGAGMPFAKPFSFSFKNAFHIRFSFSYVGEKGMFIRHWASFSFSPIFFAFLLCLFRCTMLLTQSAWGAFCKAFFIQVSKMLFINAFLFHSLAKLRISKRGNFVFLKSFKQLPNCDEKRKAMKIRIFS